MRYLFYTLIILISTACNRNDDNSFDPNFNENNENWQVFTTENSDVSNDFIKSLEIDNTGKLWVGTSGGGLNNFNDNSWERILDVVSLSIDEVLYHQDKIYVSTNGQGLFVFDNGNWINYTETNSELIFNNIYDLSGSGNEVFVATQEGLSKFDGSTWSTLISENTPEFENARILSVLKDSKGIVWAGTNFGIARFDTEWNILNNTNSNLPENKVNEIFEDRDGNVWIGTNWGLSKFDPASGQIENVHQTKSDESLQGVIVIYQSFDGKLWVGTRNNGYFTVNNGLIAEYNSKNYDLPDESIFAIKGDTEGNIWLGTEKGLVLVGEVWAFQM
jgi:ligand-binding sensor domain-containing protein